MQMLRDRQYIVSDKEYSMTMDDMKEKMTGQDGAVKEALTSCSERFL